LHVSRLHPATEAVLMALEDLLSILGLLGTGVGVGTSIYNLANQPGPQQQPTQQDPFAQIGGKISGGQFTDQKGATTDPRQVAADFRARGLSDIGGGYLSRPATSAVGSAASRGLSGASPAFIASLQQPGGTSPGSLTIEPFGTSAPVSAAGGGGTLGGVNASDLNPALKAPGLAKDVYKIGGTVGGPAGSAGGAARACGHLGGGRRGGRPAVAFPGPWGRREGSSVGSSP